jgi:hypothetical protein
LINLRPYGKLEVRESVVADDCYHHLIKLPVPPQIKVVVVA